ncbi:UNVERIFIED_CONTAM: hypothetical protein HHA_240050 [Hammondia hammondi]|eukprot:XP_008887774.1 hypothetical protein HHA_240050 [Hammondia hammondi]
MQSRSQEGSPSSFLSSSAPLDASSLSLSSSSFPPSSSSTQLCRLASTRSLCRMQSEASKQGGVSRALQPSSFAATRESFAVRSAFFDDEESPVAACLNILGRTLALSPTPRARSAEHTGSVAETSSSAHAETTSTPSRIRGPREPSTAASPVPTFRASASPPSPPSPLPSPPCAGGVQGRRRARRLALGPALGFQWPEPRSPSCVAPDFLAVCLSPSFGAPSHELTSQIFVLDSVMQATAGLCAPVPLPLSPSAALFFDPSIRCALHPPAAAAHAWSEQRPAADEEEEEGQQRVVDAALKRLLGPCVLLPPCVVALPLHAPCVLIDRAPAATPAFASLFFPPSFSSCLSPVQRLLPAGTLELAHTGGRPPQGMPARMHARAPGDFLRLVRNAAKPGERSGRRERHGGSTTSLRGSSASSRSFPATQSADARGESSEESETEAGEKALEMLDVEFSVPAAPGCPFHAAFVAALRGALSRWLLQAPASKRTASPSGTRVVAPADQSGAGQGGKTPDAVDPRGVHVSVVIPHLFLTFKSGRLTTIASLLQNGYQKRALNRLRRTTSPSSLSSSSVSSSSVASSSVASSSVSSSSVASSSVSSSSVSSSSCLASSSISSSSVSSSSVCSSLTSSSLSSSQVVGSGGAEKREGLGTRLLSRVSREKEKEGKETRDLTEALPPTAWLPLAYAFQPGIREREPDCGEEREGERGHGRERSEDLFENLTHNILMNQRYVHGVVLASYLEVYLLPKVIKCSSVSSSSSQSSSSSGASPSSSLSSSSPSSSVSSSRAKDPFDLEKKRLFWGGDLVDVTVVSGTFGAEALRGLQRKFRHCDLGLSEFVSLAVETTRSRFTRLAMWVVPLPFESLFLANQLRTAHFSTLLVEASVLAATGHASRALALFHVALRCACRHIHDQVAPLCRPLARPLSPFSSELATSPSLSSSRPSSLSSSPLSSSPAPSPSSSLSFRAAVAAETDAAFSQRGCPPLAAVAFTWRGAFSQWLREESSRLRALRRSIDALETGLREPREATQTAEGRLGPWWRAEQTQAVCTAKKVAKKSIESCIVVCYEVYEVAEMLLDPLEAAGKQTANSWTPVVALLACLQGEALDFVSELLWLFPAEFLTDEVKAKISHRLAAPPCARGFLGRGLERSTPRHRPVSFSTFGRLAMVPDPPAASPEAASASSPSSRAPAATTSGFHGGGARSGEEKRLFLVESLAAAVASLLGVENRTTEASGGKQKKDGDTVQSKENEDGDRLWRFVLVQAATAFERAHAAAVRLNSEEACRWEVALAVASFLAYSVQLPVAAAGLLEAYLPNAPSSSASCSLACAMLTEQTRRFHALCSTRVVLLHLRVNAHTLFSLAPAAARQAAQGARAVKTQTGWRLSALSTAGLSPGSSGLNPTRKETERHRTSNEARRRDIHAGAGLEESQRPGAPLQNPGSFSHLLAGPFSSCLVSEAPALHRSALAPGYLPSPPNSPKLDVSLREEALIAAGGLDAQLAVDLPASPPSPDSSVALPQRPPSRSGSEDAQATGGKHAVEKSLAREEKTTSGLFNESFSRGFVSSNPNACMLQRAPAPPVDCSAYLPSEEAGVRFDSEAVKRVDARLLGACQEVEHSDLRLRGAGGKQRENHRSGRSEVKKADEERELDAACVFDCVQEREDGKRFLNLSVPSSAFASRPQVPCEGGRDCGASCLGASREEDKERLRGFSRAKAAGACTEPTSRRGDGADPGDKVRLFEFLKMHVGAPSRQFRWIVGSRLLSRDAEDVDSREEGEGRLGEEVREQVHFITGCVMPGLSARSREGEDREARCISSPEREKRRHPTVAGACLSRQVSSPSGGASRVCKPRSALLSDLREERQVAFSRADRALRSWTVALASRLPGAVEAVQPLGSVPLLLAQALGVIVPRTAGPLVGLGRHSPEGAQPVSARDGRGDAAQRPESASRSEETGRGSKRVLWVCRSWEELERLVHAEERGN